MKFNIAGIEYEVKEADIKTIDTDGSLGLCDYETQTIVVDESLPPQRKAQVIVHELMHALLLEAGYEDDHDEEFVQRMAIVLMPFLVGNDFGEMKLLAKGHGDLDRLKGRAQYFQDMGE